MWTIDMMRRMRRLRQEGVGFDWILGEFPGRPMKEIQEAWWATVGRTDEEAYERLYDVLIYQDMGVALVNGKPLVFPGDQHA